MDGKRNGDRCSDRQTDKDRESERARERWRGGGEGRKTDNSRVSMATVSRWMFGFSAGMHSVESYFLLRTR